MTNQSTDQQFTDTDAVSEAANLNEPADPVASLSGWNVRIPVPAGWVHAATGVELSFPAGEITTIVGESGCGKSMLLAALTGTLPEGTVTSGTAQLVGCRPGTSSQWAELRGPAVAAMPAPASTGLSPTRSVGQQITEVLKRTKTRNPQDPASLTNRACPDTVDSLLHSVGLDPQVASLYPHQLSGGMATRALLAATLAARPRLLLCDEPTIGLDPQVATSILTLLRTVAEAGTAIGLITHDLDLLQTSGVADTVAVMYAGRIVEHTTADAFFAVNTAQQRYPYARALLNSLPSRGFVPVPGLPPELTNLAPGYAFTDRVGQEWIDQHSGRPMVESPGDALNPCVHSTVESGTRTVESENSTVESEDSTVESGNRTVEALQAEHLTLGHGDEPDLVDDFSLTLTSGSITGISGPSGSGKTTMARALAGLHRARSGRVLLDGEQIATRPQRLTGETALLFQAPRQAVDPEMTVRHLIAEPVTARRGSRRRLSRPLGLQLGHRLGHRLSRPLGSRSRSSSPVDVESLATRVGLTPDLLDRLPHQLSDGQLQRVCIARAIAQRPKVLLCDEATAMLDAASTATVAALVTELTRGDAGSPPIATLAISHDPALLAAWADQRVALAPQ